MWYKLKRIYVWNQKVRPEEPPVLALCFAANTAGSTVKLTKTWSVTAVTLETSTDGSTWNTYTINSVITLSNIWDKVYFRNTSETDTWFSTGWSSYYQFVMTWSIAISWEVTTLLNKNWTDTLSNFCFFRLFYYCTSLITLPKLSVNTLYKSCYWGMFGWCSNIKLSTTQTWEYQNEYRIPTTWTWTTATGALDYMFDWTWWTFTWTPTINTTYYTSNTVV